MTTTYYTPLGEPVKESELEAQERVICNNDDCQCAVIEDEYIPCGDCDMSYCLYCWQGSNWTCLNCGRIHHAMYESLVAFISSHAGREHSQEDTPDRFTEGAQGSTSEAVDKMGRLPGVAELLVKLSRAMAGDFDVVHEAGKRLRAILERDFPQSAEGWVGAVIEEGAEDYVVRAVMEALFAGLEHNP